MQLNIPSSGRGISSTKSDNMTCACDSTSCQCFHAKFHLTELDRNRKMKISPSCEYLLTLPPLLTCISVVVCDDKCVLAVTLTFGLSLLVCLLVCLAWRKRQAAPYSQLYGDIGDWCRQCRYAEKGEYTKDGGQDFLDSPDDTRWLMLTYVQ